MVLANAPRRKAKPCFYLASPFLTCKNLTQIPSLHSNWVICERWWKKVLYHSEIMVKINNEWCVGTSSKVKDSCVCFHVLLNQMPWLSLEIPCPFFFIYVASCLFNHTSALYPLPDNMRRLKFVDFNSKVVRFVLKHCVVVLYLLHCSWYM